MKVGVLPAGAEFSVDASITSLKRTLSTVPLMTLLLALVLVDTFVAPSLGLVDRGVGVEADETLTPSASNFVPASVLPLPPHAASKVPISRLVSQTFGP
jgi:hypothetical protein